MCIFLIPNSNICVIHFQYIYICKCLYLHYIVHIHLSISVLSFAHFDVLVDGITALQKLLVRLCQLGMLQQEVKHCTVSRNETGQMERRPLSRPWKQKLRQAKREPFRIHLKTTHQTHILRILPHTEQRDIVSSRSAPQRTSTFTISMCPASMATWGNGEVLHIGNAKFHHFVSICHLYLYLYLYRYTPWSTGLLHLERATAFSTATQKQI